MKTLIFTLLLLTVTGGVFATQDKKQFKIRLQSADGYLDEASFYFDLGITSAYFPAQDAPKELSQSAEIPNIYSVTSDNVNCSINGYSDLSQTAVIGVGVVVHSSGIFSMQLLSLNNFNLTTIIALEDRQLNTFTDLRTNTYHVQVNMGDSATGRFFLHVTKAVQFTTTTAGCVGQDGMIAVIADSSINWNLCELFDSNNIQVGAYSNIKGLFNFPGLSEGNYHISFTHGTYTTTNDLHVNGNHVNVNIATSINTVLVGEEINFSSISTNATQFEWSFGDGTSITGIANPSMLYYVPGDFTVNLKCSNNAGCSETAQLTMRVSVTLGINDQDNKGIHIVSQSKTVTVNMNDVAVNETEVKVYNIMGQPVYSTPITNQTTVLTFNDQPAGYYIVSIRNAEKVSSQKVYIN